jgi:hypothetical protein
VIIFVSDLQQVSGFLRGTLVSSTNKTDHFDITEMLLKVALNTITETHNKITNTNSEITTDLTDIKPLSVSTHTLKIIQ